MTTQELEERGVVDALGLGALNGGGETPPAKITEVEIDIPSSKLEITRLKGTLESSELNGRT